MIDIKLVNDSAEAYDNDIKFTNGNFDFVEGTEYVAQKLRIRLQLFFGEWYLDTSKGVKYFDIFLIQNPNINLANNALKATILETRYVTGLLEFETNFDRSERTFVASFKVSTEFGDVSQSFGVTV